MINKQKPLKFNNYINNYYPFKKKIYISLIYYKTLKKNVFYKQVNNKRQRKSN